MAQTDRTKIRAGELLMKTLQTLKQAWMQRPGLLKAHEEQAPEFAITRELIVARLRADLTLAPRARRPRPRPR